MSDSAPTSVATPPATEAPKSTVIPSGAQAKTWASMLRQSTAPKPAVPQPKPAPAAKAEPPIEPLPAAEPAAELAAPEPEPEPIAELSAEPPQEQPAPAEEEVVVPEVALPPSKDQLTEKNVEQVTDTSNPPETETAASEAADSWDPRAAALSATATPLSASQAQHQMPKAPSSGFAASAIKATNPSASRTPSHQQRRFLDQQEAVRMPGNRDVERAAVQFGAFSLNDPEEDIDGDREEPETRAQPPADSPVTQPRASLPPAPTAAVPEPYAAVQKPVASLPPNMTPTGIAPPHPRLPGWTDQTNARLAAPVPPIAPAAQQQPSIPQGSRPNLLSSDPSIYQVGNRVLTPTLPSAAAPQPPTQPASQQYGRFGQPPSQEPSAFSQKTFDSPYGQQANPAAAQSHYDGFPSQQPTQPQSQQPGSAFSSAANDYSSAYYTADGQPGRQNYNYYGQQDSAIGSRSGFGGYATSQTDLASQYPQSTSQSRFAASTAAQDQTSGNTTPNPSAQGQQQTAQGHPQSHGGQPQQHGSQFFGHPSYNYAGQGYQGYNQYMNQYGYTQGGYGGAPYGKGAGQYGQHQYGAAMAQHSPYDQTVSTAAPGYPQSTLHRADSGLGSAGLGDYGRAGSAQSAAQPGLGSGGFGGMHDSYGGRGAVYGSQAGQSFNTPSTQPGGGPSSTDDLKPFGDGKSATGPSPALGGAARPGSATNATPGQSGLPPPQAGQHGMGYGGYPAHLQSHGGLHGNQASAPGYGMGGATGQAHQNNAYAGQYGSGGGFGNNSYYNQQPRHGSGWGTNYSGGSNNHY